MRDADGLPLILKTPVLPEGPREEEVAGEPLPKAHMSPEQTGRMKRTVDYRTDLDSRCGGVVPRTHGEGAPAATLELPLG